MSVNKKLELLLELDSFAKKGYRLSQNFTTDSSMYELKFELETLKCKSLLEKKEQVKHKFLQLIDLFELANDKIKDKYDLDMMDSLLEELYKISTINNYSFTKNELKELMKEFIMENFHSN